jgi:hypothetical protein
MHVHLLSTTLSKQAMFWKQVDLHTCGVNLICLLNCVSRKVQEHAHHVVRSMRAKADVWPQNSLQGYHSTDQTLNVLPATAKSSWLQCQLR